MWKAAEDIEGMRSHTEFLADTLQQAVLKDSAELRAEKAKAPSSKAGMLKSGGSKMEMVKVETFEAGVAASTDGVQRILPQSHCR